MKILHIFKSEPDDISTALMKNISEGEGMTRFNLYKEETDYERLIDLIFAHDKIICWW